MKNRVNLLVSAIVFAIAVFAFIYFVKSKETNRNALLTEKAKLLENKEFPNFPIIEPETNKDFSDELHKGEVVIVYMLSDCEACKKETQTISEIQPKINTKVFGIMFEDEEVVKKYIKDHNIKFPVLIDKDKKILSGLSLQYFPTNLKLKDGIIQKALFGSPQSEAKLLEFIQSE
ncbi:MAG: peroxiredoxin family protein [Pyrinomonadaceae bacterium]